MAKLAQRYQDELPRLKKWVENFYEYFKPNYDSFHKDRAFIYDSSMTQQERDVLADLLKPQIEANTLEAFISRLVGEFGKSEPSLVVKSNPNRQIDPQMVQIIEGHMRDILFNANKDALEDEVYEECLSGGFSGMKVITDYEDENAFEQGIKIKHPYDVTMVGYDPLAVKKTKHDGRYCFECFPKTKEEFEAENPNIDISDIEFVRGLGPFDWSYTSNDEKILLVCDLYEKKKKAIKIHKLSDDSTVDDEGLQEIENKWKDAIEQGLTLQQPPTIVKSRKSTKTIICRWRFIQNQVLEYIETDYDSLPIVFTDGNSKMLKIGGTGGLRQKTRSYIYHAKDIQRLKNYAFQTLANELENMVQHKWKMPIEGVLEQYKDPLLNNQLPMVVLYQQFKDNDPNIRLDSPQEIVRPPIPPEVSNTIMLTSQLNQMVLGSFDSALGINDNQLSGKAIIAGATQSNAAAMPYIMGFLNGLNQVAQIILELIPKYYKTARTIPVLDKNGQRSYVKINQAGGIQLNYKKNDLSVTVEAGVNFAVQKQQSLQIMEGLVNAMPGMAQFITQDGLDIVFDNMEFRGADILKSRAPQFMQMLKQQAQAAMQAQQMQAQTAHANIQATHQGKQAELALQAQKQQYEQQNKSLELQLEAAKIDNERGKLTIQQMQNRIDALVQLSKANAEDRKTTVEAISQAHDQILKEVDQNHRHVKEAVELHHKINQPQSTGENNG